MENVERQKRRKVPSKRRQKNLKTEPWQSNWAANLCSTVVLPRCLSNPQIIARLTRPSPKANALNKDDYKDFSGVEAAINAVDRSKKTLKEQGEVDAMAKAIEDAIAALQFKGADYSKVDEAIAKANALKKDDYKDFSAVEAAVSAVVRGKPLSDQAAVDAMAKAIEDAIAALEKKPVKMAVQLPQTGDDSNLALWTALLLVSGAAICTMMAGKKKNYEK